MNRVCFVLLVLVFVSLGIGVLIGQEDIGWRYPVRYVISAPPTGIELKVRARHTPMPLDRHYRIDWCSGSSERDLHGADDPESLPPEGDLAVRVVPGLCPFSVTVFRSDGSRVSSTFVMRVCGMGANGEDAGCD